MIDDTPSVQLYRCTFDPRDTATPLRAALIRSDRRSPHLREAVMAHDDVPADHTVHVTRIVVNAETGVGAIDYWLADGDGHVITHDEHEEVVR